jgi:Rrf2 family protein
MISTKGRYALRVLIDLAEHRGGKPVPLKDVADRQDISKKYLEIIVKELVAGGFVSGVSGKGGGYRLTRDPKDYTVWEVLDHMEGSMAVVTCLASPDYVCERKPFCKTLPMWQEFNDMVYDFFQSRTLEDLVGEDEELAADFYVI